MKKFEEYKMELINLSEDIITTSGPYDMVDGMDINGSGTPHIEKDPFVD